MASSRVVASSSSGKSNLVNQSSIRPKAGTERHNSTSDGDKPKLASMIMEDLIHNIYGHDMLGVGNSPYADGGDLPFSPAKGLGEDVWREITAGKASEGVIGADNLVSESDIKDACEMTLEDFLARAGAVMDDDVRFSSELPLTIENQASSFGNEMVDASIGGRRGRRRPLLDLEDRVTLQRQKRMIKNRESAARSRERKQAYTAELESLVHQLEQDNAQLHIDLEQSNKERLQQRSVLQIMLLPDPQVWFSFQPLDSASAFV